MSGNPFKIGENMEEIKNCPFCNSEVELTTEDNYGYWQDEWYIKCDCCGLLFGWALGYDEKEVIAKWNMKMD